MAARQWYALVSFWADTPDDGLETDDMADLIADRMRSAAESLPGVVPDTTKVPAVDTIMDGWDVDDGDEPVKLVRR